MATVLEAEYEWYIQQANNPENTPEARELWQQLADGLATRVGASTQQETLW